MMCTDRDKELASDLYGQLQKICTGMGMAIEKPQLWVFGSARLFALPRLCKPYMSKFDRRRVKIFR